MTNQDDYLEVKAYMNSGGSIPPPVTSKDFVVKDSGKREEYENGFVRDTEEGKPDYARVLAVPGLHLIPIEMLERLGEHLVKGAVKYGEDNWRKATGSIAKERFARSLARHVRQLITGDRDEDHAAAIVFNAFAYELTPTDEVVTEHDEIDCPKGIHSEKCAREKSKGPGSSEYKAYWKKVADDKTLPYLCRLGEGRTHSNPCECTS